MRAHNFAANIGVMVTSKVHGLVRSHPGPLQLYSQSEADSVD
jgi:hypothetical protein